MIINKRASEIYIFFVLQITFISLKFFPTVFVFAPIISFQVISEFSVVLVKYFSFSELPVAGFKIIFFTYMMFNSLYISECHIGTHIDFYHYSTFNLNYTLFHQTFI